MEPKRNHFLRIYSEDNRMIYEEPFWSADNAHRDFLDTIWNLTRYLPKGHVVYVTRWNGDSMMAMEKVVGIAQRYDRKGD